VAEIQLYDLALFAHITAVVVAFGATFAYPFFQAGIERVSPRSVPAMLRAMHTTSRYLVTPGSLVVLASGVYLTIERWDFDQLFVLVGLVIVIAVIVLGAGYFDRQEARAMRLAERDVASAGNGEVVLSDEYWAVSKRLSGVGMAASLLILVAIFFMAVKP
jgi:hypothetical protein